MDSAPKAYQWDFDLPSIIDPPPMLYRTLSVGIFQWLPKASGKGIKRSPASARVLGYMAEPDRIFAKAAELCRRLNAEATGPQGRPTWLQKQYSIPRPASVPPKHPPSDLRNSRNLRKAKDKVLKEILGPAGFVKGKHLFVRHVGNQIHGIEFQTATWGGVYFVNVGFHYDFLPSGPKLALDDKSGVTYHMIDLLNNNRLENWMRPTPYPGEWNYWGNMAEVQENVNKTSIDAVEVLNKLCRQWKDPADFLAQATPPNRFATQEYPGVSYHLSLIALHVGQIDLARDYMAVAARSDKEYQFYWPAIETLRRRLDKLSG